MRLSQDQVEVIKKTIARILDADAGIWLFGSRLDDHRRGGDVDLYVETANQELLQEVRCKMMLQELLDLHVDLVIKHPGQDQPIYRIAQSQGVRL